MWGDNEGLYFSTPFSSEHMFGSSNRFQLQQEIFLQPITKLQILFLHFRSRPVGRFIQTLLPFSNNKASFFSFNKDWNEKLFLRYLSSLEKFQQNSKQNTFERPKEVVLSCIILTEQFYLGLVPTEASCIQTFLFV